MTTIATDGHSMAGDGQVTGNGLKHMFDCQKVYRLKDGEVVGFTGSVYYHADAIAYLQGERESIDLGDEFEALILLATGVCECMDGKGRRYRQSVPAVAGSGSALALGAMGAGADPRKAVEIAARFDEATGGEITVLTIETALKEAA